jgi:hypothetical protein
MQADTTIFAATADGTVRAAARLRRTLSGELVLPLSLLLSRSLEDTRGKIVAGLARQSSLART